MIAVSGVMAMTRQPFRSQTTLARSIRAERAVQVATVPRASNYIGQAALQFFGVWTCSGRKPTAMKRVRIRHGSVVRSSIRTGNGNRTG